MRASRRLLALIWLAALGACATSPRLGDSGLPPADVEDRVVIDGEVLPYPEQNTVTAEPLGGGPTMSPVVKRLVSAAQQQRASEDWDGASESLERALRIEPRNPLLWGRLADVKFAQRAWRSAIQLAAKANTLAANNVNLRRQNWYLMANAYEALGDQTSAQKYRSKLMQ